MLPRRPAGEPRKVFCENFAGPGIAPGTRGYEPRDVLLVHPAAIL